MARNDFKPRGQARQTRGERGARAQGGYRKSDDRPARSGYKPVVKSAAPAPKKAAKPEPKEMRPAPVEEKDDDFTIEGKNAVWETLKAERSPDKLLVDEEMDREGIAAILAAARRQKVRVEFVPKARLNLESRTGHHQGLIAFMPAAEYTLLDDMLDAAFEQTDSPMFVLLDRVQDPYNVGAVIRSADCAGANGVIITEHNMPGITGVVARSSAGAVAHMPIARVTNLVNTIRKLKERGVFVFASDMEGEDCANIDLTGAVAIVTGSEGKGVRQLVMQSCDGVISIPMTGHVGSLNASVSAGILLYEAVRQRRQSK